MADYTSKEALNRNGAGKALGNYKGGIRKALLKRHDLRDTYKKLNKQLIKQFLRENEDKIVMNRIDLYTYLSRILNYLSHNLFFTN